MIRKAERKDLARIVEIYNQTITLRYVTADTEPVSVESRIEWFHQFDKNRPIWVLEENNNVLAWCSIKSFYGRPAYKATVEIGIYIDENERQRGFGSNLLLHAFVACKQLEIETILAFIFANNVGSMHFFLKHGFTSYGLLPAVAEIDHQKIDLAILGYKFS